MDIIRQDNNLYSICPFIYIMRVENHTIKGEGLRCKQPKKKARWFTDGKKTTASATL